MDLHAFVSHFGGWALFIAAWLEGEAAVIMGGALARAGYWPWWAVWLVSSLPAAIGHQLYFWAGRRFGPPLVARLGRRWGSGLERAQELVREHQTLVLVTMRFAYGIRLPLPILCGAAGVETGRFVRYNIGTALVWAGIFTGLGYGFGSAATAVFSRWSRAEGKVLLASLAAGVLTHFVIRWVSRARSASRSSA